MATETSLDTIDSPFTHGVQDPPWRRLI